MKKSLFAVAAATAFAGAAQAQSSVTVYGILDVGAIGASSRLQASNSAAIPNYATQSSYNSGVLKQTQNTFGQSAEQTSRLGFRGSEDLGGGKSAFFTVEVGLTPNSAGASSASATNSYAFNNRQSFVGIADKALGSLSIGTQYQPIHLAIAATDPGQQNNMAGSIIYTGCGDSGTVGCWGGNTAAYQSRFSNSVSYVSPVTAGAKLSAFYVNNSQNATSINNGSTGNIATGGSTNSTGWALGLDYSIAKAFLTAGYSNFKQVTSATNQSAYGTTTATAGIANNGAFALWTAATGAAINTNETTMYFGGTYDFGILKAYAQYISRKAEDTANSNIFQKRTAQQIGVRGYVTKQVEAWAMGGTGSFTPYGVSQNSAPMTTWQLGSNYWLSKRTNLYGIYGVYNQGTRSYVATTSALVQTTGTASANVSTFGLGVRHTF